MLGIISESARHMRWGLCASLALDLVGNGSVQHDAAQSPTLAGAGSAARKYAYRARLGAGTTPRADAPPAGATSTETTATGSKRFTNCGRSLAGHAAKQ
jgi:hypothetical protein